jgi:hypothetical protein
MLTLESRLHRSTKLNTRATSEEHRFGVKDERWETDSVVEIVGGGVLLSAALETFDLS